LLATHGLCEYFTELVVVVSVATMPVLFDTLTAGVMILTVHSKRRHACVAVGSTLEGKEDLLLSGLKMVLTDPNNKVISFDLYNSLM